MGSNLDFMTLSSAMRSSVVADAALAEGAAMFQAAAAPNAAVVSWIHARRDCCCCGAGGDHAVAASGKRQVARRMDRFIFLKLDAEKRESLESNNYTVM